MLAQVVQAATSAEVKLSTSVRSYSLCMYMIVRVSVITISGWRLLLCTPLKTCCSLCRRTVRASRANSRTLLPAVHTTYKLAAYMHTRLCVKQCVMCVCVSVCACVWYLYVTHNGAQAKTTSARTESSSFRCSQKQKQAKTCTINFPAVGAHAVLYWYPTRMHCKRLTRTK